MIEVTPAILPLNVGELRSKVEMVKEYVKMVQLDFCDGKFVPSRTWPYSGLDTQFYDKVIKEEEGLPYWEEVNYEFDLMVENAKDKFDTFLKMGPKRIIFHVGAEQGLAEWFDALDPYYRAEIEFGVAITVDTPITVLDPLLTHISFVQCMGIAQIGKQSQPFDERVLDQIRAIKKMYPNLFIAVDGSVNRDTAHRLVEAGAQRLAIGSALFKAMDIKAELEDYRHLITEI
jgi:ribulose-phosphate 3-epimerase